MLPDPRQPNPEFYQYVLDALHPLFAPESDEWPERQEVVNWLHVYEATHCTEECVDARP